MTLRLNKISLVPALLLLLMLTGLQAVAGSSTGALACPSGEAAVGGAHLTGEVTNGPLSSSAIQLEVVLDGKTLSDSEPNDFMVGRDYALNIIAQESFRGFLIRLGSGENDIDTTEALVVSPENSVVKIASTVCVNNEDVGGLTHTNNLDKTGVAGTLRLDEIDTNMPLDVTVVVKNRDGESIYHYSRYMLNAVDAVTAEENGDGSGNSSGAHRILGNGTVYLTALLLGLFGVAGLH